MTNIRRMQKLEARVASQRERLDSRVTQLLVLLDQIETLKEQLYLAQQAVANVKHWCETCDGSGEVFQESQFGVHGLQTNHDCPDCDGKGYTTHTAAPAQPPAPAARVPAGYALVGIEALEAWGKLEEVKAACVYPSAPSPKTPCALCGHPFDHNYLGAFGCPNCEGEGLPGVSGRRTESQSTPVNEGKHDDALDAALGAIAPLSPGK